DRPTEAEQPLKQLIADVEAAGLQAKPIYLLSLNNLGQLYLDLERYPEAREYLERARALPMPAKGTLSADTQAILTSNLAYVAHGLGELDEADRLFTQAEAEFAALRPGGSAELASLLNNRAFLLDDQGKADEAYAMRKASVAMREQVLGDSHPALVRPLMDLARDAMMRGETDYALEQAIKAVAVAERAYAEPSVDRVYALVMHAGALINAKQFLQSGEVLMRAEAEAATLQAPPDYLTEGLSYTRRELCKRPRTPAVPSCAGIVPTEPALP
ncbi:MAG: tetratricopeptide repeat protein, partial [Arenimonas sp.]|nr:tetratricopeptide repeat protein [Arenimonas sp.]